MDSRKIRNLASLDYPRDKLAVVIACDGCTDNTAAIAQDTIQEAICADTLFIVHDHEVNRGKVGLINMEMESVTSDITALSDVSASSLATRSYWPVSIIKMRKWVW